MRNGETAASAPAGRHGGFRPGLLFSTRPGRLAGSQMGCALCRGDINFFVCLFSFRNTCRQSLGVYLIKSQTGRIWISLKIKGHIRKVLHAHSWILSHCHDNRGPATTLKRKCSSKEHALPVRQASHGSSPAAPPRLALAPALPRAQSLEEPQGGRGSGSPEQQCISSPGQRLPCSQAGGGSRGIRRAGPHLQKDGLLPCK